MRLKFSIIMIFISILSILGCSNHLSTKDSEFPPLLNGVIVIDGVEYPMERGGYQWKRRIGLTTEAVQTDHASPYQMAEDIEPIQTNPNQKVDIQIEENPKIEVYLWNEKGRETEIKHKRNQITLPSSQGKYIYEVFATWKNGTVSYTFVVEII